MPAAPVLIPNLDAILAQCAAAGVTLADFDAEIARQDGVRCAGDVVYWQQNYAWTYDPREANPIQRFEPWPKQIDFLRWLEELERRAEPTTGRGDGCVLKCRDWGVTNECCAFGLHRWLYRPMCSVGFGSRKLDLVDKKGDPNCIFEKIRFLLYHLPEWMMPRGFKRDVHDTEGKLINPANGATITGEGGDNIGRGGRYSVYFADEKAFMPHADSVDRSLSQSTRFQVDVSTPNGPGNNFATKCQSGRVPVFVCDFTDDPRKNRQETLDDGRTLYPWLEEQKKKFDPVTVAQEILHDFYASVEGICIPAAWVRAAVDLKLPGFETSPVQAGLDIAEEGVNKSALVARRGPVVSMPIVWGQCNTTETAWRARDEGERLGCVVMRYDHVGVGAGVKGTWESAEVKPRFQTVPLNGGSPPTDDLWPDGKKSKEKFLNARAEDWWKVRIRFEKTYEWVELGVVHPLDELISIPNHPDLIAELSMPLIQSTATGKTKVESKKDMRARGVKSPDVADALVMAFHDGGVSIYHGRGLLILGEPADAPPSAPKPPHPLTTLGDLVPAGGVPDDWSEEWMP